MERALNLGEERDDRLPTDQASVRNLLVGADLIEEQRRNGNGDALLGSEAYAQKAGDFLSEGLFALGWTNQTYALALPALDVQPACTDMALDVVKVVSDRSFPDVLDGSNGGNLGIGALSLFEQIEQNVALSLSQDCQGVHLLGKNSSSGGKCIAMKGFYLPLALI